MKHLITLCLLQSAFCLLLGCGCSTTQRMPLQPGEKIIFEDSDRAARFRSASRNDPYHTNRVVQITEPTVLTFD